MSRPPITAPFRQSQVRHIRDYQHSGRFHPLTCPHHSDTKLDVERDALTCPHPECSYRQDWVPAFCADTPREPPSEW